MSSSGKGNVQQNPYPGYPGPPRPDAKDAMRQKLEEICNANPPDTRKIIGLWRALMEEDKPRPKIRNRPRLSTQ